MSGENFLADNKKIKTHDYEYISNDPDENADNFDPKWAPIREMSTDEERYRAIRKRWGNANIPNPQINLTCRQMSDQPESYGKGNFKKPFTSPEAISNCTSGSSTSPEAISNCTSGSSASPEAISNCTSGSSASPEAISNCASSSSTSRYKKKRKASRYRSRSCTKPYEKLISNLEKNYQLEYFQLMFRHKAELQDMLQFQLMQLRAFNGCYDFGREERQSLHIHQEQEVIHLLTNQYKEVQYFLGEKNENIDACKKYLEEVRAFFTFYQKINDDKVTLQMTDEQHEHTVETERMYALYSKFYC